MKKYSGILKWSSILLLLVVLRIFVFEIYLIPSESMMNTLMPGDIVLASKIHFGTRFESENGIWRSPGISSPGRGDIVIFNFPEADTIYENQRDINYHEQRRKSGNRRANEDQDRYGNLIYQNITSRMNYVKRIVGLPGDTLQINNDTIFINGKELHIDMDMISNAKTREFVRKKRNERKKKNRLNNKKRNKASGYKWAFPHDAHHFKWNLRSCGPLVIPKKGEVVNIDSTNISLYEFIIRNHEGHDLKVIGNFIKIDDEFSDTYQFEKDYYYVLGDNRSNSLDSRKWGYLPEDHLKAKVELVIFNTKPDSLSNGFSRLLHFIR